MKQACKRILILMILLACLIPTRTEAGDNPVSVSYNWTDRKEERLLVSINIKQSEINAYGFTVSYDAFYLVPDSSEESFYDYSDDFRERYLKKGTGLCNAVENRILFSGINIDSSAEYSGEIAKIRFRIKERNAMPDSVFVTVRVNNLLLHDVKIDTAKEEFLIQCPIVLPKKSEQGIHTSILPFSQTDSALQTIELIQNKYAAFLQSPETSEENKEKQESMKASETPRKTEAFSEENISSQAEEIPLSTTGSPSKDNNQRLDEKQNKQNDNTNYLCIVISFVGIFLILCLFFIKIFICRGKH